MQYQCMCVRVSVDEYEDDKYAGGVGEGSP